MTVPAKPPLERMSRVDDTFSPIRSRVVTSSSEGKMENSRASRMVMVIIRIMIDREMFRMIITSSIAGGSGMMRNSTITTTASTTA